MSTETFDKLKAFVETNEVCRKAMKPLKKGAEAEFRILEDDRPYRFYKDGSGAHLADEPPKKPDFTLVFPTAVVEELVSSGSDDIGWYGVKIFEYGISKDPETKILAKIHVGFMTLMKHGYFGMVKLGGRALLGILKKYELHKPSRMKEIASRLRKK
ncbi:hypothetical protein ACFL4G_03800 [Thermodesulfobacteriota bacterium]